MRSLAHRKLLLTMRLRAALATLFALPVLGAEGDPPPTAETKAINERVDALERRVKEGDPSLPALTTDYRLPGGSEGVPPQFSFFFEWGKDRTATLRLCKVHVGREVYSVDSFYYFDEQGRPLKYLRIDSGVAGEPSAPATRAAIFYDKQGRSIWSSKNLAPALPFKRISELFQSLRAASQAFE